METESACGGNCGEAWGGGGVPSVSLSDSDGATGHPASPHGNCATVEGVQGSACVRESEGGDTGGGAGLIRCLAFSCFSGCGCPGIPQGLRRANTLGASARLLTCDHRLD